MYCLLGKDMATGLCCDDSADSLTGCKTTMKHSSLCSRADDVMFKENFKYTRCPFDGFKCGNPQRKIISDEHLQTVSTSLDFRGGDVCPYIITNEMTF